MERVNVAQKLIEIKKLYDYYLLAHYCMRILPRNAIAAT